MHISVTQAAQNSKMRPFYWMNLYRLELVAVLSASVILSQF